MIAAIPLREQLTADEIDDVQYSTRANERQELEQTVSDLAVKYNVRSSDIISAAVDSEYGNTVIHLCAANGLDGESQADNECIIAMSTDQYPQTS